MRVRLDIIALLLLIWGIAIYIVNPTGEFMINDDFAFTKALHNLIATDTLGPTWMGPQGEGGGPALITHLLWGMGFSKIFGPSMTVLRLSVLTLSVLGSIAFFFILKTTKAHDSVCFWGTVTLIFNPLYFSQSFTFMTDITFISLLVFSWLSIQKGIEKNCGLIVAIGVFFGLLATLTRQFGVIGLLAFLLACFIHPQGREFGRVRAALMTVLIAVVPWLAFERFLYWTGSTPITQHELLHELLTYPFAKGFPDYPIFVIGQLFQSVLGYTAFFVSPVAALLYWHYLDRKAFRYFLIVVTAFFSVLEIAIYTGFFTPPEFITRNIIFNFGIGPILLKDTYILGIQRTQSLPLEIYYIIVWWTIISLAMIVPLVLSGIRQILEALSKAMQSSAISFLSCLTLIFILLYGGIIILVGIRDRYLIPLSAAMIIFLLSYSEELQRYCFSLKSGVLAAVPLIFLTIFSVGGTHDFMALKRQQAKAIDFITNKLGVKPCNFDGGMEFNGYHCYHSLHEAPKGMSWWWVDTEDYVITLGNLKGYETVKEFPFRRLIGRDGAIHILKPNLKQTP